MLEVNAVRLAVRTEPFVWENSCYVAEIFHI